MGSYKPYLSDVGFAQEGFGIMGEDNEGTATGGSTTTSLEDTNQAWTVDGWIGSTVNVYDSTMTTFRGSAEITDNDATTLTHTAISGLTSGDIYDIVPFAQAITQQTYTQDLGLMLDEAVELPDPENVYLEKRYVGVGRNIGEFVFNNVKAAGKISGGVRVPRFLKYAFGKCVDVNEGAYYSHTITETDEIPSICVEASAEHTGQDFIRYFRGTKINSLTLTAGVDDVLKANLELMTSTPQHHKTATKSTVSYYTDTCYRYFEGALTYLGRAFGRLNSFEWVMKQNLKEKRWIAAGTGYVGELLEEFRDYEVKINLTITDLELYDELNNRAGSTLTMLFNRGTNDTLTLTCTDCTLFSAPHPFPDGSEIEVEALIRPKSCSAIVNDDVAAY